MLFNNRYMRTLEAASGAAWLRQNVIAHNIANVDTPNYRAKNVVFRETLTRAMGPDGQRRSGFDVRVVTPDQTIIRPDRNNVDLDTESLNLYRTYVQHSMILDKIRGQFNNIQYVLNNLPN